MASARRRKLTCCAGPAPRVASHLLALPCMLVFTVRLLVTPAPRRPPHVYLHIYICKSSTETVAPHAFICESPVAAGR